MTQKLTVWYNTKCPVCNAGIGWQHDMRKVVLRTSLSAEIGRGGVGPIVGFAIGFRP